MRYKITFRNCTVIVALLMFILPPVLVKAQTQTVGLFLNDSTASFDGYTLFAPGRYTTTYLIDNNGLLIHSWDSNYQPGQSVYLLETGHLLRTAKTNIPYFNAGGAGGAVENFDWDGNVEWTFVYANSQHRQHHDIEFLPNGNVLMIAWEFKTEAEALTAGRNPNLLTEGELWPDHIIEVEPTGPTSGNIVWEWHLWDHLIQDYDPTKANYGVVSDHPELVDLNFSVSGGPNQGKADWTHINSIDYNEQFDQIILSVHGFCEIWVIDHSTTTAQAAGHTGGNSGMGGDILYRWGNPRAYQRGNTLDQKFYFQHDAQWIADSLPGAGNILVFNNGQGRPGGNYSTIDEFVPPVDTLGNYTQPAPGSAFGPSQQSWIYQAANPTEFYSQNISGAQRLPNGNTLICDGPQGTFFEVTLDTDVVWLYINPVTGNGPLVQGTPIPGGPMGLENNVFRIYRYAPDYPGFAGYTLLPGDPIELYPTAIDDQEKNTPARYKLNQNYPNPFNPETTISFSLPNAGKVTLKIYNILGEHVATLVDEYLPGGNHQYQWQASSLPSDLYYYTLKAGSYSETKKMILLK